MAAVLLCRDKLRYFSQFCIVGDWTKSHYECLHAHSGVFDFVLVSAPPPATPLRSLMPSLAGILYDSSHIRSSEVELTSRGH